MFICSYIYICVPLQLSIQVISKVLNDNYSTSTFILTKYITPISFEYIVLLFFPCFLIPPLLFCLSPKLITILKPDHPSRMSLIETNPQTQPDHHSKMPLAEVSRQTQLDHPSMMSLAKANHLSQPYHTSQMPLAEANHQTQSDHLSRMSLDTTQPSL
jgi:hypothetical protein